MKNDTDGILIVLEGVDGGGKTSQVRMLAEAIEEELDREVVTSFEPTHGQHGKKVRASFHGGPPLSRSEEFRLFTDDREEHAAKVVEPALEAGKVVVLDRYYFSTAAYQSRAGGAYTAEEILFFNDQRFTTPDLTFMLDLPLDVSMSRIGSRLKGGETATIYEKGSIQRHVRETFLSFAGQPGVHVVSALGDILQVHAMIKRITFENICQSYGLLNSGGPVES